MTRRKLMRKLSAQPLDQAIARTYLRTFPSKQLFTNPRGLPAIDSRRLFGDEQPMHLEVGCGTADYLRALTRDDPRTNFVGVDVAHKPLLQAVRMAAAQALPNIRFIRGDLKLMYPLLIIDSLQAVSVHFPDPHVQTRFRKRRIVTPAFLDAIYRALAPGGQLSIMTDHQALFMDILTIVEQDTRRLHLEGHAAAARVGAALAIGGLSVSGSLSASVAPSGCRPPPAARATYERAQAVARAQLGDDAFAAAWAAGRALTLIRRCA